jgi:hypothetical protein
MPDYCLITLSLTTLISAPQYPPQYPHQRREGICRSGVNVTQCQRDSGCSMTTLPSPQFPMWSQYRAWCAKPPPNG